MEKSLLEPPRSCDGEPAPERVPPAILPAFKAPRKGDLCGPALEEVEGSVGEELAVEEPERGRAAEGGRKPREGGSARDDGMIMDYGGGCGAGVAFPQHDGDDGTRMVERVLRQRRLAAAAAEGEHLAGDCASGGQAGEGGAREMGDGRREMGVVVVWWFGGLVNWRRGGGGADEERERRDESSFGSRASLLGGRQRRRAPAKRRRRKGDDAATKGGDVGLVGDGGGRRGMAKGDGDGAGRWKMEDRKRGRQQSEADIKSEGEGEGEGEGSSQTEGERGKRRAREREEMRGGRGMEKRGERRDRCGMEVEVQAMQCCRSGGDGCGVGGF